LDIAKAFFSILRCTAISLSKGPVFRNGSFHDLRHTFAVLPQDSFEAELIFQSAKVSKAQIPIMTQQYAHNYPKSLRDGVDTLDKYYHFFIAEQLT